MVSISPEIWFQAAGDPSYLLIGRCLAGRQMPKTITSETSTCLVGKIDEDTRTQLQKEKLIIDEYSVEHNLDLPLVQLVSMTDEHQQISYHLSQIRSLPWHHRMNPLTHQRKRLGELRAKLWYAGKEAHRDIKQRLEDCLGNSPDHGNFHLGEIAVLDATFSVELSIISKQAMSRQNMRVGTRPLDSGWQLIASGGLFESEPVYGPVYPTRYTFSLGFTCQY